MEPADESICTSCGGAKATFFLTTLVSGVRESRNLCKECYEQSLPGPAKDLMEAMKQSRCRFCGGKATMTDAIPQVFHRKDEEMPFLCFSCGSEYHRFLSARLGEAESELNDAPYSEQEQHFRLVMEEADSHMRRWIIQRDN